MTAMSMPEASVDEDGRTVLWQNDVRPSWKTGSTKPVAKAKCVQSVPDFEFNPCVLPPDPRHQRGALLRADDIGHQAAFRRRVAACSFSRCGAIRRATSSMTGTTTEFP